MDRNGLSKKDKQFLRALSRVEHPSPTGMPPFGPSPSPSPSPHVPAGPGVPGPFPPPLEIRYPHGGKQVAASPSVYPPGYMYGMAPLAQPPTASYHPPAPYVLQVAPGQAGLRGPASVNVGEATKTQSPSRAPTVLEDAQPQPLQSHQPQHAYAPPFPRHPPPPHFIPPVTPFGYYPHPYHGAPYGYQVPSYPPGQAYGFVPPTGAGLHQTLSQTPGAGGSGQPRAAPSAHLGGGPSLFSDGIVQPPPPPASNTTHEGESQITVKEGKKPEIKSAADLADASMGSDTSDEEETAEEEQHDAGGAVMDLDTKADVKTDGEVDVDSASFDFAAFLQELKDTKPEMIKLIFQFISLAAGGDHLKHLAGKTSTKPPTATSPARKSRTPAVNPAEHGDGGADADDEEKPRRTSNLRSQEFLALRRIVQQAMCQLLGYIPRGEEKVKSRLPAPPPNPDSDPVDLANPTMAWNSKANHPYNLRFCATVAQSVLAAHPHLYSADSFETLCVIAYTYSLTLRDFWTRQTAPETPKAKRLGKKADTTSRYGRKKEKCANRLRQTTRLGLKNGERLIKALGPDGQSSDSCHEGVYWTYEMEWRDPGVKPFLRTLDDAHVEWRRNKPGAQPRKRLDVPGRISTREPVEGLWEEVYNMAWLAREPWRRHTLRMRTDRLGPLITPEYGRKIHSTAAQAQMDVEKNPLMGSKH